VRTDVVSIGTRVRVTDLANQHRDTFAIVGAWDGDPDKGAISYLTPVAQSLLNHKVGEEIEFEMDGSQKKYRIEAIEPAQPASAPSSPEVESAPVEAQPQQG
jgi:transcription elongation GreA/GreB family factor